MMSSHDYGDARGGAGDGKDQDQDQDQDQAVPAAAGANAAAGGAAPNAEGEGGGERDLRACFRAKNTSLVQYVDVFEAEEFDDVKLVSEMDAGDCESIPAELDKEVSIKKAHRKKLSKVLAVLMRAALDTAEVKKVRERVGFTTSNRASRARVLECPGPSDLKKRARAFNGPPLCRAARARSLLTSMIEGDFVRI